MIRWLALAALCVACAPSHIQMIVRTAPTANRGLPMYLVIRTVDETKYLTESYSSIADKITEPDQSIVRTVEVFPGRETIFNVKLGAGQPLGMYFLFTDPGIHWRTLLEPPFGGKCMIRVEGNEIQDVVMK